MSTASDLSLPVSEHDDAASAARLNWLRAGLLGANDGIVSVAAVLVGVAGAGAGTGPVVAAGTAALVGGAISMALGEYISVSGARDAQRTGQAAEQGEARGRRRGRPRARRALPVARGRGVGGGGGRPGARATGGPPSAGRGRPADAEDEVVSPWRAAWVSAATFTVGALLPFLAMLFAPEAARVPVTVTASLVALRAHRDHRCGARRCPAGACGVAGRGGGRSRSRRRTWPGRCSGRTRCEGSGAVDLGRRVLTVLPEAARRSARPRDAWRRGRHRCQYRASAGCECRADGGPTDTRSPHDPHPDLRRQHRRSALAFWLHRSGHDVTVVEKNDGIRPGGQAVDFKGATHMQVLREMGILDELRQYDIRDEDAAIVDEHGRTIGGRARWIRLRRAQRPPGHDRDRPVRADEGRRRLPVRGSHLAHGRRRRGRHGDVPERIGGALRPGRRCRRRALRVRRLVWGRRSSSSSTARTPLRAGGLDLGDDDVVYSQPG